MIGMEEENHLREQHVYYMQHVWCESDGIFVRVECSNSGMWVECVGLGGGGKSDAQ